MMIRSHFAALTAAAVFLAAGTCASAGTQETVALTAPDEESNVPFAVENLMPGDEVTQSYCIRVEYTDEATLFFRACADSDDGGLSGALKLTVSVSDMTAEGEIIYEDVIGNMTEAVSRTLPDMNAASAYVYYDITVSLASSAGNEYAGRTLAADFVWWMETEESGDGEEPKNSASGGGTSGASSGSVEAESSAVTAAASGAQTSDQSHPLIWAAAASGALICTAAVFIAPRIRRAAKRRRT